MSRPLMECFQKPTVQCSWPFWGTGTSKSAIISIMNVWWKCWSIVFYNNILKRKNCCDPYERNSLRWNEYEWNRRADIEIARVAIKWKCIWADACDFSSQTHARESSVAWWCSNTDIIDIILDYYLEEKTSISTDSAAAIVRPSEIRSISNIVRWNCKLIDGKKNYGRFWNKNPHMVCAQRELGL